MDSKRNQHDHWSSLYVCKCKLSQKQTGRKRVNWRQIPAKHRTKESCSQIQCPLLEDKVDYGLSCLPAGLNWRCLTDGSDNLMPFVNFIPPVRDYELGLWKLKTKYDPQLFFSPLGGWELRWLFVLCFSFLFSGIAHSDKVFILRTC
jgi:hypothetical protein